MDLRKGFLRERSELNERVGRYGVSLRRSRVPGRGNSACKGEAWLVCSSAIVQSG